MSKQKMQTDKTTEKDEVYYLWHLEQLGLIDCVDGLRTRESVQPTKASAENDATQASAEKVEEKSVSVALIDTGVDFAHPNLCDAITTQVDYGPKASGVIYKPDGKRPQFVQQHLDDLRDGVRLDDILPLLSGRTALATPASDETVADDVIDADDPSLYFGSHGTACAGLIAGRNAPEGTPGAINYTGVNPDACLISMATPYSHELLPVIIAFCDAYTSGAEVILMPRGLPDPKARLLAAHEEKDSCENRALSNYATRIDGAGFRAEAGQDHDQARLDVLLKHREILIKLMTFIAARRYLVLAAGNSGYKTKVGFPASAMDDDQNVVIVGAKNQKGEISTYSDGQELESRLIWMPSDDSSAVNQDKRVLNMRSFSDTDYPYNNVKPKGTAEQQNPYSVLSLDVRGQYGYVEGGMSDPPRRAEDRSRAGLYTLFGGTSAASSIAAGLISLLLQAGHIPKGLSAAELKTNLQKFYSEA